MVATTTTLTTTNSWLNNIYRYSILGLLILLILLLASYGRDSAVKVILCTILLIFVIIIFEAFTNVCSISVNAEHMCNINNLSEFDMNNTRSETMRRMNNPVRPGPMSQENQFILASNENGDDVPCDPRGLMHKRTNCPIPRDIYYDKPSNFVPNEIPTIYDDKFDYLQRGYIYDDRPGSTETDDEIVRSPMFGKQGYFIENGCNFGTAPFTA